MGTSISWNRPGDGSWRKLGRSGGPSRSAPPLSTRYNLERSPLRSPEVVESLDRRGLLRGAVGQSFVIHRIAATVLMLVLIGLCGAMAVWVTGEFLARLAPWWAIQAGDVDMNLPM